MESRYSFNETENRVEEDAILEVPAEQTATTEKRLVEMEVPAEVLQALDEMAGQLGISRHAMIIRVIGEHLQEPDV